MVKIRLKRFGAKKNPHYRIVVTDKRRAREGSYLESVGLYDPHGENTFSFDEERLGYWLGKGAQMTPRVKALVKLHRQGKETAATPVEEETVMKATPKAKSESRKAEGKKKPGTVPSQGGNDEGTA